MDETYSGMADLLKAYAASDRLYLSPEERKRRIELLTSGLKAIQFLDTSGISPVLRDTIAVERLLQLKEILDRIGVPSLRRYSRSGTPWGGLRLKNGGCRARRSTSF